MRLLFLLTILLTPFISYSQVGSKLKLRQLEVGPPNAAVLTDSTGAIIFGAAESGGGGESVNTIYTGSGTSPVATLITVTEDSTFAGMDFGIGNFPDWPEYNGQGRGFYYGALWQEGVGIQFDQARIEAYDTGAEMAFGARRIGVTATDVTLGAVKFYSGAGNPNGVVTSSPGAIYMNTSGGAGTTLYIKESGDGTNTGWVGK